MLPPLVTLAPLGGEGTLEIIRCLNVKERRSRVNPTILHQRGNGLLGIPSEMRHLDTSIGFNPNSCMH
jgi:hypothetical protein